MRLLWAECHLGRAAGGGVVCRGLWGQPLVANSLGGGAERRCGTCSAHAKLNCGLEHAQAGLRRCSALSLWAAWAADAGVSPCSTCSDCCGGCSGGLWLRRSALGHRDRPRRLRRPAALRAQWSSWPGRCPRARPSRRRLLVCGAELGRTRHIVCVGVGMHPMLDVP